MILSLSLACAMLAGPYNYTGPMSKLMASGIAIAPVSKGLPFAIELTAKEGEVQPLTFELKGSAWKSAATLKLTDLSVTGGQLTGKATFENGSGAPLGGVRFDLVELVESATEKQADGKDKQVSHSRKFETDAPILFGDLQPGDDEADQAFKLSGISWRAETQKFTIKGLVSGLRYESSFDMPDGNSPHFLEVDSAGNLFAVNFAGSEIYKMGPKGENGKIFATLPAQASGMAVDPTNGDVYGTVPSSYKVFIFSANGTAKGEMGESNGFDLFVNKLRFGKNGTLYALSDGATLWHVVNKKVVKHVDKAAGEDLGIEGIDIDGSGNIWLINTTGSLIRIAANDQAKKIAGPGDWKLGNLTQPHGCRADREGNVYIGEDTTEDSHSRVTVFDPQGRVIRVFGRGAKKPNEDPVDLHRGQVANPGEFAFGKDGTVYVCHGSAGGIMVFKPF